MNLATAPLRDLALKLLVEESEKDDAAGVQAAFRVCGKLGVLLTKLAGAAGFRSLLSRALALAQMEVPWLRSVVVPAHGKLEGLTEAKTTAHADQEEETRGGVVLVAHLLGLLHTFIGEPLTLQLLKEIWPDVSIPRSS